MDGPNTLYSECADGDPAGGGVGGGGGGGGGSGFVADVALQAASGTMLRRCVSVRRAPPTLPSAG